MEQVESDCTDSSWPAHWTAVISHAVESYGNVRCERWQDELVYMSNGLPVPVQHKDRVLYGFARKTARRLRNICTGCGRPAKPRFHQNGWLVQCSACFGRTDLANQIDQILQQLAGEDLSAFDGKSALWHEHAIPTLLRECIPSMCWRRYQLPQGNVLRYVSREDVEQLTPWLRQVQSVMRAHR